MPDLEDVERGIAVGVEARQQRREPEPPGLVERPARLVDSLAEGVDPSEPDAPRGAEPVGARQAGLEQPRAQALTPVLGPEHAELGDLDGPAGGRAPDQLAAQGALGVDCLDRLVALVPVGILAGQVIPGGQLPERERIGLGVHGRFSKVVWVSSWSIWTKPSRR